MMVVTFLNILSDKIVYVWSGYKSFVLQHKHCTEDIEWMSVGLWQNGRFVRFIKSGIRMSYL